MCFRGAFGKMLAFAAFGVSLMGCDIKENREDCPCRLELFFGGANLPAILSVTSSGGLFADTVRTAGTYTLDVPAGEVTITACGGAEGMFTPGEGLRIVEGRECPPVYLYSKMFKAGGVLLRDTVLLRKNHCRIRLKVRSDGPVKRFGWKLALSGNVCGYDLSGRPLPGVFSAPAAAVGDMEYSCTVPRQTDSSMMLEIRDEPDVLRTFAVGEYIAASGYDWTRPELEDIVMEINYSRTGVTFSVSGWKGTEKLDVVI